MDACNIWREMEDSLPWQGPRQVWNGNIWFRRRWALPAGCYHREGLKRCVEDEDLSEGKGHSSEYKRGIRIFQVKRSVREPLFLVRRACKVRAAELDKRMGDEFKWTFVQDYISNSFAQKHLEEREVAPCGLLQWLHSSPSWQAVPSW